MRAAVFCGDTFRVKELPKPEIGEYEALVKVRACGVCGTDVHKAVHKTVEPPIVLGHEVAGDVIKTGEKVQKFKVGDKVVVPHHTPCFACFHCHHGHYTLCDQYTKTNIDPGGFSEYIRVPQPNVERAMLHTTVEYEEAAFVEPVACCIHGWEKLRIVPGDTVLVVGGGPIGLLHLELAKAFNAKNVYVADIKEKRLEFAEKMGGIPVNAARDTVAADIVVVAAGNAKAYELALKSVKKGGQVSFFAECPSGSAIALDPNVVYGKELTFSGSYSSTPFGHWKALNLIEKKVLRVKKLITHRFGLEGVEKAIELAYKAEDCLKIMIRP